MGYKKEHKQQQARQWHKEFFPLKVQTFFCFHRNTTESWFCWEFRYENKKRLEWMCKSGTSWQMFTSQVTLASHICVNTHLHRSHLLWLATQVVQNNNNNFTHHFRISMLFMPFYYATFDYRALLFINWQLLMANSAL